MERMKRIVSLLLCAVMVIGFLPVSVFAAESDAALTASLNEAKDYIHSITLDNTSNDPATVVKNFGTHFTWDNEKREGKKGYLYDWSYYNGVVFEGIEYLYEVTGEQQYKNYVMEYMSSLIASNGTWATCTNNSSKECAGYNANHGADCYKTASLLLDAYEMSKDDPTANADRYLKIAKTLYADLDTAASKYSLSACGNNFNHTWPTAQDIPLWLDGLYMILPFRAEYAKYTGNTAELNLIVDRLQWVSDNMYNSSKKLFYHAADSTSNSGTYWLRSIGWYAAAIVDVMDSMEGQNLETMKTQLKKLVDGMKACQNASNGMWLNNMDAAKSSTNPYETSGTSLVCYAVMKAVNNGWLDESYADMAILAFKGICNEKLSNNNLKDICFKGAPGSSNSTFYDNEGKGLGPFIMFYAEMLEYVNKSEEPEETVPETSAPVETEPVVLEYMIDEPTGVRVDYHGITGLTVNVVEPAQVADRVSGVLTGTLVAYDIDVEGFNSGTADVTIAIPDGVDADNFAVFYLPDLDEPEQMPGSASTDGKTYTFTTTHFSTYVGGELVTAAEEPEASTPTVTGNLPGGEVYVLDKDGVDSGVPYLIVSGNSGTVSALTNNNTNNYNTTASGTNVVVVNEEITVENDSNMIWTFSGTTSGNVQNTNSSNRTRYVVPGNGSLSLSTSAQALNINSQNDGRYKLWYSARSGRTTYFYVVRYNNGWTGHRQQNSAADYFVYLFKQETKPGTTVTFSVAPGALNMMVDDAAATLVPTITLGEGTVDSSNITWTSGNINVVTVSNGVVTPVAVGKTTITATLNSVNGTALVDPISVTIDVDVRDITLNSYEWTVGQNYNATVGHPKTSFADVYLTLNYSEGDPVIVSAKDITFTYKDAVGSQVVEASYDDLVTGAELTTTFPIEVLDKVVASGIFSGTKAFEFVQDSSANFTGLHYSVVYACGCEKLIPYTDLRVSGYDIKTPGVYENCPVTYNGQQIGTVKVTVTERTSITGSGELQSGKIYTLNTVAPVANEKYLIVNVSNGSGVALTNNNGSYTSTNVYSDNGTILLSDDSTVAWTYGSAGNYKNGRYYISPGRDDLSLTTSSTTVTTSDAGSNRWYIYNTTTTIGITRYRYVSYNSGAWGGSTLSSGNRGTTYLYRQTGEYTGGAVTFTVDPGTLNLRPNGSVTLDRIVTVNGVKVNLDDCAITWTSGNTAVATVENGVVTGVANGQTTVTATLTAYQGTPLKTPITLNIPVTVENVHVVKTELTTPSGAVVVGAASTVHTGGKLSITYSDGTMENVDVSVGMIENASTAKEGIFENLTVVYNGVRYPGFTLTVMPKPDANYPTFPEPGSVQVDKYITDQSQFQNTGVAQVELTAAGLPVQIGVDVILVVDLSNSMARVPGGGEDTAVSEESAFNTTKLYMLKNAVSSFATILLGDPTAGNYVDSINTISMVTFGGFDKEYTNSGYEGDYEDVTRTLFLGQHNTRNVTGMVEDIYILKDSNYDGGYKLSFDGGESWKGNYGNTNYDYAFMETYNAVNAFKAQFEAEHGMPYSESGRTIDIIFMTDGAPTNYDGVYYRYRKSTEAAFKTRPDCQATWLETVGSTTKKSYVQGTGSATYDVAGWYNYFANKSLYWATQVSNMPNVGEITSIGFDLGKGGFSDYTFTEADGRPLNKVLSNLVDGETLTVHESNDEAGLTEVYNSLAKDMLKYAAREAYYLDGMGNDFNLQMKNIVSKFDGDTNDNLQITLNPAPVITVTTHEIYGTGHGSLAGKRIPGTDKTVETVTFNNDGSAVYSDKVTGNILKNGVICAENFWYNTTEEAKTITLADGSTYSLPGETFYWNIGTINEMEYVLSYPVYLEGACEGDAEAGSYDTNTHADLHYINWLDNDAVKTVPTPVLAWDTAAVYFGFYLVNSQGQPITNAATGATGEFRNAVKVTPRLLYSMVHWNETEQFNSTTVAVDNLPYGYELFDKQSSYKIVVNSDLTNSHWTVGNDDTLVNASGQPILTTYVTDYRGSEYTTTQDSTTLNQTGIDYTHTTVWFAVEYNLTTVPDVVVIDYGLSVDVDVLANDMFGGQAVLNAVGATSKVPVRNWNSFMASPSADFAATVTSNAYSDDLLTAGDVSIHNGEVRYTPNTMEMPTFDRVIYEAKFTNTVVGAVQYFYGELTVIPATIIYYEDDFLDYESFHVDTTTYELTPYGKEEKSLWQSVGTAIEGATQSEDRPGEYYFEGLDANNIYGYDPTYGDLSTYSLGSAMKATVDAAHAAHATFSFYGTGFDVVSLTDCDAGAIFVDIYQINADGTETEFRNHVVDNYYGYVLNYYKQTYTYSEAEGWVITAQEKCDKAAYEDGDKVIPTEPGTEGQTEIVYERIYEIDPKANNNALYQVPVMKVVNMPYGHYKVVIRASYKSRMNHGQNDGNKSYNFTLDAIRIYDPANDGINDNSGVIEYAYSKDGEGWPVFFELRNQLLGANSFDNVAGGKVNGAVFIDGNSSIDDNYIMTDYRNFGPNNEVYLAKDQAVAFKLDMTGFDRNGKSIVEDVHIALKTENGADTTYEVYYLDENGNDVDARTFQLNTATDRYYKLPNYDKGVLVIHNTGSGLLSITNLKVTFNADPYGVVAGEDEELEIPMTISEGERDMAVMSLRMRAMAPVVPDETVPEEPVPEETLPEETLPEETVPEETVPEVFEPGEFSVKVPKDAPKAGHKIKVDVTTSADVAYVVINGQKVTDYKEKKGPKDKAKTRTWKLDVIFDGEEYMEIEVVAYNEDDLASEPVSNVVTLKKPGKKK